MNILLASSEVHPYSKTGGLADMVGALAKSLAREGNRVGLVTPLYAGIRERFPGIQKVDWWIDLPLGNRRVSAELWAHHLDENLTIYFIHQPEFFFRNSFYQEKGSDYSDNADRFIFFSKCVVQLARYLPWRPELLHVHDWQAAMAALFVHHQRTLEGWVTAPPVCLTIHNLAYQGLFEASAYQLTNLPLDYFNLNGAEYFGLLNCLKTGILYSDFITTVSPRYAREIMTEEYGFGLDGVLRRRKEVLFGILNGVDYEEWNTTNNPHLVSSYSSKNLRGKAVAKQFLQRELGLPEKAEVPLFGNVSRLTGQKGVDIQLGALEEMLASDIQFVLLGSGAPDLEKAYRTLAKRYPTKVGVQIGYNHELAHRIEAGSDYFLMPSRFEPSGLNQLYSLRYGTIPIVRRTGGLDDSVVDLSENLLQANGIKFNEYSVRALAKAIRKATILYQNKDLLRQYRHNAMAADFSWDRVSNSYLELYDRAMSTAAEEVLTGKAAA